MVKFRRDSPGWPHVGLSMFVDAFDERALAQYRRAVHRWSDETTGADDFSCYEVRRALLELADHDGDVDRAVRATVLRFEARRVWEHHRPAVGGRAAARRRSNGSTSAVECGTGSSGSRTASRKRLLGSRHAQAVDLYVAAGRADDALSSAARLPSSPRRAGELAGAAQELAATPSAAAKEQRQWAVETAEELAGRPHGKRR